MLVIEEPQNAGARSTAGKGDALQTGTQSATLRVALILEDMGTVEPRGAAETADNCFAEEEAAEHDAGAMVAEQPAHAHAPEPEPKPNMSLGPTSNQAKAAEGKPVDTTPY